MKKLHLEKDWGIFIQKEAREEIEERDLVFQEGIALLHINPEVAKDLTLEVKSIDSGIRTPT